MVQQIDLSTLPPPDVIETLDFEAVLADIKSAVIAAHPAIESVLDLESEPVTKLMQVFAYREITTLRARVNDGAKALLLAYATGADLDHMAARDGVTRLENESDESLRARTQIALEGYSTAGPAMAYIFHALSASAQVLDVHVDSLTPGEVRVVVLADPSDINPNGVPGQALLNTVIAALNADDVRPLCDTVSVVAAEVLAYNVTAAITCVDGPDTGVVLAAANAACEKYVAEQFRLGRDITISGLHAALHQPGALRVDLTSPAGNIVVADHQAARCLAIAVTLAGVGQ